MSNDMQNISVLAKLRWHDGIKAWYEIQPNEFDCADARLGNGPYDGMATCAVKSFNPSNSNFLRRIFGLSTLPQTLIAEIDPTEKRKKIWFMDQNGEAEGINVPYSLVLTSQ